MSIDMAVVFLMSAAGSCLGMGLSFLIRHALDELTDQAPVRSTEIMTVKIEVDASEATEFLQQLELRIESSKEKLAGLAESTQ